MFVVSLYIETISSVEKRNWGLIQCNAETQKFIPIQLALCYDSVLQKDVRH